MSFQADQTLILTGLSGFSDLLSILDCHNSDSQHVAEGFLNCVVWVHLKMFLDKCFLACYGWLSMILLPDFVGQVLKQVVNCDGFLRDMHEFQLKYETFVSRSLSEIRQLVDDLYLDEKPVRVSVLGGQAGLHLGYWWLGGIHLDDNDERVFSWPWGLFNMIG